MYANNKIQCMYLQSVHYFKSVQCDYTYLFINNRTIQNTNTNTNT